MMAALMALAIGAAKTEDAGQYKVGNNGQGVSIKIVTLLFVQCEVAVQLNPPELKHTVSIRAPPSISSSSPASITVERGQDVTLSCTGMPRPAIKWTRVVRAAPLPYVDLSKGCPREFQSLGSSSWAKVWFQLSD